MKIGEASVTKMRNKDGRKPWPRLATSLSVSEEIDMSRGDKATFHKINDTMFLVSIEHKPTYEDL